MTELNKELAMRAHSGTSWHPEERGRAVIDGFNSHLVRIREDLMKRAETEEDRGFIDDEMRILKSGYASKMNDQLASQSSCYSTMIAGPSNFDTRRAQKANNAYDNKIEATNAYLSRAISSINRRLKKMQVEAAGGEAEVMKEKLRRAEERQTMMKESNKTIRKKTNLSKVEQESMLYESWELSNNNANIRRMRERVDELQKKEDTPTTEIKFNGGTIIDNCEDDRVQINFDAKPDDAMRAKLKGHSWRWAPSVMMWQRKRTNAAMRSAKEILEVHDD